MEGKTWINDQPEYNSYDLNGLYSSPLSTPVKAEWMNAADASRAANWFGKPTPPRSVAFLDGDGKEVGRLRWDDGIVRFEGNADESAQVFFDAIKHLIEQR